MSAASAPTSEPAAHAPPSQANARATVSGGSAEERQRQSLRRHWKQITGATRAETMVLADATRVPPSLASNFRLW